MPIDFSNAWKTCVKIINEAISLLPNVVLAIVILLLFLLLAAACKLLAHKWAQRRRKHLGIALLLARRVQTIIFVRFLDCAFRGCAIVQSR
jgi:hypothetical protein